MGRGPKDIQTHLWGDLLVVRLSGVLTAAEQHLVKTHLPEKGRDRALHSVRIAARPREEEPIGCPRWFRRLMLIQPAQMAVLRA